MLWPVQAIATPPAAKNYASPAYILWSMVTRAPPVVKPTCIISPQRSNCKSNLRQLAITFQRTCIQTLIMWRLSGVCVAMAARETTQILGFLR